MAITNQQQQNIIALTVGMFNAAPGARNLSDFATNFEFNNGSYVALANDLIGTDAYQRQFDGIVTLEGRANKVLSNLGIEQGTEAYTEARAYFEQRINEGVSEADLIVESIEYLLSDRITPAFESVQAQLNNKVDVATYYSVELQQSSESVDDLRGVIGNVTADPASVDVANDAVVGGTGNTFALTPSIDVLNGTAGNDTFIGTITGDSSTTTLNSGDTINGGAGNDTLRVLVNGDSDDNDSNTLVTLNNVENVSVRALSDATLNASEWNGVQNVISANSNSDVTVNSLNQIVNAQMTNSGQIDSDGIGGDEGQDSSTLELNYRAAVVRGNNDVQNVSVNGAQGTFRANGIETYNVNVMGAFDTTETNAVQFDGNALRTINVSGEGNLDTILLDTVTTFNAADATGNLRVNVADTGNLALTGGEGDDTFFFGGSLTARDTVNGGGGFNTLRLNADTDLEGGVDDGDFSSAANAARFNNLESIQRVAFDGNDDGDDGDDDNGVTVNGSTFTNSGITNIEFNTQGDDFINNAGAARTYELGVNKTGDATFNMNGSSTVVNIDLFGNSDSASSADNIVVNLAGSQAAGTTATVNLTSIGANTTSVTNGDDDLIEFNDVEVNSIDTVTAVSGSDIVLAGEGALYIGGFENNANVDASALEGNLIIRGSAYTTDSDDADDNDNGDTDTEATVTNTGTDTFTLGAGQTVIQFGEDGQDSGIVQGNNVLVDVITGFKVGQDGDVLDIGGSEAGYSVLDAEVQSAINALSGQTATLEGAANLAAGFDASNDSGDSWTAFTFQGNTYALYDNGGNGEFGDEDTLVQLSGVSAADLTVDNFA